MAPEVIFAITFTNKVAQTKARLEAMLGAEVVCHVTVKTFHAFGALFCR